MMLQIDEKNKKAKENIKAAWSEADLFGVLAAGFDHFVQMVLNGESITFSKFLEYTGTYFDRYILDVCEQKRLNYVGGSMILKTGKNPPDIIQLFADFYFQTSEKAWVMQKKKGHVSCSRFSDWDTDPSALELQRTGELKLSIESPEIESR